jgi:DNA-binding transcriptional regulator YhcF (GntR family)
MAFRIDAASGTPPYEQLRTQVASQVAGGELAAGTRLPTVRSLAEQLGVAVNTVARAYRELEADGVVTTNGRHGTVVASLALGDRDALALATEYVDRARRRGLTLTEATRLVEQAWPR